MKKLLNIIPLMALLMALATGCNTPQQTIAYKSIYTVEKATVAAYDGYVDLVIVGSLPTNDFPRVSKSFNTFQASALVALDAVQFNTNAVAPASLAIMSQDLINLITQIQKQGGK